MLTREDLDDEIEAIAAKYKIAQIAHINCDRGTGDRASAYELEEEYEDHKKALIKIILTEIKKASKV